MFGHLRLGVESVRMPAMGVNNWEITPLRKHVETGNGRGMEQLLGGVVAGGGSWRLEKRVHRF